MPQSGYVAQTFTAGEVPTTTLWNFLWSNDASFNTGNGFNDGVIQWRHLGSDIVPSGTIHAHAGSSSPSSAWLICDGSNISRTIYATLFNVIGTTYGAGDGTTTFAIPNLKGRVPVGQNAATFATLGATGGEETHTLSVAEMPSHAHNHGWDQGNGWASGTPISGTNGATSHVGGTWSDRSGTSVSGLVFANGGGGAHNNLQPFIVVNFIIKT